MREVPWSCRVGLAGTLCLAGLTLCAAAPGGAPENVLSGHWEGAYGRLGSIQTVMLDLSLKDGKLEGTFDVPDLAIFGEPIREVGGEFPNLSFRITYGTFSMHVSPEIEEMTGGNAKWNPPLTLHLKRREKRPEVRLPREEVQFKNGSVTLAGTLVKPEADGPRPAIVIVHGSGEQGREDGFYRSWGEFFAGHGITALIYDKRGVGRSSGNLDEATFDDLAGDVIAGVEMLKGRDDVDPDRIGLFGISQGGWLAPLAASHSRDVGYMILDVGPAVSVREQELDRVEYSLRADEFSDADIQEALDYTKRVFEAAYTGDGKEDLFARFEAAKDAPWADHVQLVHSEEDLHGWRVIRYDPAPVLRETKVPLLALFGEFDVLVPPKENVEPMQQYLKEAGNDDFTIRVIPGVNHDMETFGTLRGGDWDWPEKYWVWAKRSPELNETIAAWLADHEIIR